MDELISFYEQFRGWGQPLIKAAMIHSQFESIHPFSDGNGRIGRVLISLYLYKAKVINFPFFYISEAINMDKAVYYRMLTDSRTNSLDEWIKYFLHKVSLQTTKHIGYIDALNALYTKTKTPSRNASTVRNSMRSLNASLHPVLNANMLRMSLRYPRTSCSISERFEEKRVLLGDDRKRGKTFYFAELIDLARGA